MRIIKWNSDDTFLSWNVQASNLFSPYLNSYSYVEKNDVFEKTFNEVKREDMIKDKLKREERKSFNEENIFKPSSTNSHSYNYGLK